MSDKESKSIGEFSITFKGRKPEDGDIKLNTKKRYRQKGEVISGAAKMRAAYKTRKSRQGGKKK
ncbi:MAG: hypothetical protein SNH63_04300 [Rikenellaceae bacterium]